MSKILAIFLCLILTLWSLPQTNQVLAETTDCKKIPLTIEFGYNLNGAYWDAGTNSTLPKNIQVIYLTFTGRALTEGATYRFQADYDLSPNHDYSSEAQAHNDKLELDSSNPSLLSNGAHRGVLQVKDSQGWHDPPYCQNIRYFIGNNYDIKTCQISFSNTQSNIVPLNQPIHAIISHARPGKNYITYVENFVDKTSSDSKVDIDDNGNADFTFFPNKPQSNAKIEINEQVANTIIQTCQQTFDISATAPVITEPTCSVFPAETDFTTPVAATFLNAEPGKSYTAMIVKKLTGEEIKESNVYQSPNSGFIKFEFSGGGKASYIKPPPLILEEGDYFIQINNTENKSIACTSPDFHIKGPSTVAVPKIKTCDGAECASTIGVPCSDDPQHPAIATAIGCIPTNPPQFVQALMTFILGISGGLAFLMMLLGVFQMLTSAGNPETLNAGRERLTSAIIGLLLIIFAILLLQIIGVDILHLPGFGRS